MTGNIELVNMIRAAIQEEILSVRQEVRTIVQEELKPVNERLAALEAGQQETNKRLTAIEATVNDIRVTNRKTHKNIFTHLNTIWGDIKLLSSKEEKAIR